MNCSSIINSLPLKKSLCNLFRIKYCLGKVLCNLRHQNGIRVLYVDTDNMIDFSFANKMATEKCNAMYQNEIYEWCRQMLCNFDSKFGVEEQKSCNAKK